MPRRSPRQQRLFAYTIPGIEDLATAEIESFGGHVTETLTRFDKRDSILIFSAPDPKSLLSATLLEDALLLLLDAPAPATKGTMKSRLRQLPREEFEPALAVHNAATSTRGKTRSYKAVARVAGRQGFKREDLQTGLLNMAATLLPHWTHSPERAGLEVWGHAVGERLIVGLRISSDELAQRRYKRMHLAASLKPVAARALIDLAGIAPGEIFLDPMCGAGTILRERADAGPATIIGGDSNAGAIEAARANAGRAAHIARWDAARLPLRDRSIDTVVCNPPYGRQHGEMRGLDRLYARMLREMARVLRPDGRCVILTGEPDILLRALPPALILESRRRILLRGLPVSAFVLVRP